jgi:hypothetical protein
MTRTDSTISRRPFVPLAELVAAFGELAAPPAVLAARASLPDAVPLAAAGIVSRRPVTCTCLLTLRSNSPGMPSSSNDDLPLTSGPPEPPAPFAPTPAEPDDAGLASVSMKPSDAGLVAAADPPEVGNPLLIPEVPVARPAPERVIQPVSITVCWSDAGVRDDADFPNS